MGGSSIMTGTLLERIAWSAQHPGHATTGASGLRRSIINNLTDILNAMTGLAPAGPDPAGGLQREPAHDDPMCAPVMEQAIALYASRHEPRLHGIRVVHLPDDDPAALSFILTGRSASGDQHGMVFAVSANQGRIQVR